MPHKCTRCGKIFRDGAPEILNGCPNCGWNKFLYVTDTPEEVTQEAPVPQKKTPETTDINELINAVKIEERPKSQAKSDSKKIASVKILGPGSYELNIESLLNRPEIVMALKEEGMYMVHLPSVFGESGKKRKRRR
jgi:hypothetical protein